jgi:hypothetical protein
MIQVKLFIVFVVFNIILAYFDARRINRNARIYHGINGAVYSVLLLLVYLLTRDWMLIIGLAILRIPVFNTALNYFRDKELTYLSESTTSIIDQFTNSTPKKIGYWTYHTVLLAISLILSLL